MRLATMAELVEYMQEVDAVDDWTEDERETMRRWDWLCHEWGKGSYGGIGGSLTRSDPVEHDEKAWRLVEDAMCKAHAAGAWRTRGVVSAFYLRTELHDAAREDSMPTLARHLGNALPEFRLRDGMSDEQRAEQWLNRALVTLAGIARTAKLVY